MTSLLSFCMIFANGQSDNECKEDNEFLCVTSTCNACIECNPMYLTTGNCDTCTCEMHWWVILIVKL